MRQTNFDNDEAVGYLADRLARLGIEDALAQGSVPSRAPRCGSATCDFDWQPRVYAGVDFTPGNRGTDYRLEEPTGRPTAAQRLAAAKPAGSRTSSASPAQTQPQLVDDFSDYSEDDE